MAISAVQTSSVTVDEIERAPRGTRFYVGEYIVASDRIVQEEVTRERAWDCAGSGRVVRFAPLLERDRREAKIGRCLSDAERERDEPMRGTYNIWSDGPPLSSTPARDAEWWEMQRRLYDSKPKREPSMPFAAIGQIAPAIGLGGLASGRIADGSYVEVSQAQLAQLQLLQAAQAAYEAMVGQVGYGQGRYVRQQDLPAAPEPEPEPESMPRVRELDLDPAGEVAQPKVTAREIEL